MTAARLRRNRERRLARFLALESRMAPDEQTAAILQRGAFDDAELIATIASKSKNLKFDLVHDLKEAAASIKVAVVAIGSRAVSDETRQLQAENAHLRVEVADFCKELATIRAEVSERER